MKTSYFDKIFGYQAGQYWSKKFVPTIQKCQEICRDMPGCIALSYRESNQLCFIFTQIKFPLSTYWGMVSQELCCGSGCISTSTTSSTSSTSQLSPCDRTADCLIVEQDIDLFYSPFYTPVYKVEGIQACRILCHQTTGCTAITYRQQYQTCLIYNSTPPNQRLVFEGLVSQKLKCPCN